ncbi:30S ribosomal protein S1 [Raoultella terrigena]|uniref:Small ribosomal subunit protein bS1 n=1 Tax=Raoultella terrigena TaxID=577 RepID=A0A4U9DC34_RAOTE|nr:30S ribosomal protein S1 [Raoultella terrigena]
MVAIAKRYPEGTKLTGRVTNLTDYGCFVEIEEGVEGLVHVSEMDWTNKNIHPSKVVNVGDVVEVYGSGYRRRTSSYLPGPEAVQKQPMAAVRGKPTTRATVLKVKSSLSLTSVSSSAWTAASMAWFTCLTSPGTLQAKKQYVNTKKATKSQQLFCRLTQNVSVSLWALSSSQKIRSTTGLH